MKSATSHLPDSSRADRSRGAALAVVLWITFGLVSIALYFGNAMSMQLKSAANIHAGAQAEQAIEGAARFIKYYLTTLESEGVVPYDETYRWDRATVGEASFWAVGRDNNNQNLTEPHFDLIDESGKINLNMDSDTQLVDMLEKFPFMTPEFAAAIADWRDEDQEVRENGAESESYSRSDPAYVPKDGPFREHRGAPPGPAARPKRSLLGEDFNRNGILDPNEDDGDLSPPERQRRRQTRPWTPRFRDGPQQDVHPSDQRRTQVQHQRPRPGRRNLARRHDRGH